MDDRGSGSLYADNIFWNNRRQGCLNHRPRFELDITDSTGVHGCFIHGQVNDLRGNVDRHSNAFDPPDAEFDPAYQPRQPRFARVGYRTSAVR